MAEKNKGRATKMDTRNERGQNPNHKNKSGGRKKFTSNEAASSMETIPIRETLTLATTRFARNNTKRIAPKTKRLTIHVEPKSNESVVMLFVSSNKKAAPRAKKWTLVQFIRYFFSVRLKIPSNESTRRIAIAFR